MGTKLLKLLKQNNIEPRDAFFVVCVVVIFLLTRFYLISKIPPSIYWDEASIGYNAYSVLKTGRDEWGNFLPIHFRAFGEFKLPVYIYSVSVAEKFLGLSEIAVRIPAVFYSLGVVILVYLTSLRITKNKMISLMGAFYLTFSPWFFIFSRTGYEATAGLFWLIAGIYMFLFVSKSKMFYFLSVLFLIMGIYSYNSIRILAPIFLLMETALLLKRGFDKRILILGMVFFAVSLVPIVRLIVYDAGSSRFVAVGETNPLHVASNYLRHFSYSFLSKGDVNPRSTLPGFGVIWLPDLIILPFGILAALKARSRGLYLILSGFLLSLVPSAISKEAPHALRALSTVIFLAIIWGMGLVIIGNLFKKYAIFINSALIILIMFSFESYMSIFLTTYSSTYSQDWQYGYKELFQGYKFQIGQYSKVVVSDRYAQPYIFELFYDGIEPNNFISKASYNSVDKWGFSTVLKFDKFTFKKIENSDISPGKLVFATPEDKPPGYEPTSIIKFLDGSVAFFVYQF